VVGWYLAAGELNYGDTLLRGVTEYLSGDPSGTRTPYSLSPTGIPVFLEGGQNLVLFSGRLRVGSPLELALAAGNLLLSLIGQPAGEGSYIRRQQTVARWGQLLHRKITAWLELKARLDRYHKVMGNALMQDLTPWESGYTCRTLASVGHIKNRRTAGAAFAAPGPVEIPLTSL